MTIDHRKVVALATNETPFVKRVDDIDDYQVTTTVTRYTKSVWLTDRFKIAALDLNFAYNKSLTDSITGNNLVTFTRASSGTYIGADGLIKTASTNEARFDHDPVTHESLGLLIEEARTNKIYYSQDLTTGGGNRWKLGDGAFTGTNNSSPLAPDGVSKMWLVNLDSTSGTTSNGSRIYASNMAFGSVANVFSFYARSVSGTGNFPAAYFDGSNYIKIYIPLTTTTKRYIIYIPANTGGSIVGFSRRGTTHDETLTQAYVWGCQCEEGNFVTSHIPTFGSQATRATDIVQITGNNFSSFYNTDSNQLGTMFVDAGTSNLNNFDIVEISNGNSLNRDTIRHAINDADTALTSTGGGQNSQQFVSSGTASIRAAANSVRGFAVNGTSTTDAGNPINNNGNMTQVAFGRRATSGNTQVLNGHIKRFAYFSTNLDVNTLQAITS